MAGSRKIGSIYAELSLKDKMTHGLNKAGTSLKKFGKDSAKWVAAGAGVAVGAFMKQAITAASDMQETVSKSKTVFGESAGEVSKWAENAASAFGQSNQAALESAATIGNMFVAMGMSSDKAASMSMSMVQLGSDLASFNNTSPEEAILAIGSALRGESEPIRRYGVMLDDAALKAKALAMGIYDGTGTLKPASKSLAAYELILEQTKIQQGDFIKTSDGLANSTRQLSAAWEDAKAAAGEGLTPAVTELAKAMKGLPVKEAAQMGGSMAAGLVNAYVKGIDILAKHDPIAKLISHQAETDFIAKAPLFVWNKKNPQAEANPFQMAADMPTSGTLPAYLDKDWLDATQKKADAMAEYSNELAKLEATQSGDSAMVKNLEKEWMIRQKIAELIDAGFGKDEASRMANELADAQAAVDARAGSKSWESSAYSVNDYQSRGLGLGGSQVPTTEGKKVNLLTNIRDLLKEAARANDGQVWNNV